MAKLKIDAKISYVFAIVAFICGWVLTFFSFFVPPKGVIDQSVLLVLGQALAFSGGVVGITQHINTKFKDMQLEIDSKQPCTQCRDFNKDK